jgi:hypothetical protein
MRRLRSPFALVVTVALTLLVGAFSFPPPADAAGPTATVTLTPATEYETTDPVTGAKTTTPMPASDIKEHLIKWFVAGTTRLAGQATLTMPATSTQVNGLICGNYDFVAVTVVKDSAISPSRDSAPPAVYATEVSCKNPKAPAVSASSPPSSP